MCMYQDKDTKEGIGVISQFLNVIIGIIIMYTKIILLNLINVEFSPKNVVK